MLRVPAIFLYSNGTRNSELGIICSIFSECCPDFCENLTVEFSF